LKSKRLERYTSYLEKRAKIKPFKHKKKNKVKKQNIQQPVHAKPWHKSSVRYEKARKSFAKANAKLANVRNNYQQKTTTEIVRKSAMVATEDLKVTNMMKNPKLSRAIQGAGWGAAVQMFAWKCARYGRIYQKIDTFEPSSKVCHVCGYRFENLTLDVRNMKCPVCHTELDRDENASDNVCTSSVRDYNAELYEKLYGEPFDDGSQKEQRSETSINNELPLSSGSRDVEMTAAGSSGAGETSALLI
jgi:IS605 OrfB family transposase